MLAGWLSRLQAINLVCGHLLGVQKMGDIWVVEPKWACTPERVHLLGWAFRLRPSRTMHRDWRGAPEEVQRRSVGEQLASCRGT